MENSQNIELQQSDPRNGRFSNDGLDDPSDSDVQQVSGKSYDPAPDQRDMRRLGKRQELKVRGIGNKTNFTLRC